MHGRVHGRPTVAGHGHRRLGGCRQPEHGIEDAQRRARVVSVALQRPPRLLGADAVGAPLARASRAAVALLHPARDAVEHRADRLVLLPDRRRPLRQHGPLRPRRARLPLHRRLRLRRGSGVWGSKTSAWRFDAVASTLARRSTFASTISPGGRGAIGSPRPTSSGGALRISRNTWTCSVSVPNRRTASSCGSSRP